MQQAPAGTAANPNHVKQLPPLLHAIQGGAIGVKNAEELCIAQVKQNAAVAPDAPRDRDGGGNSALHYAAKRGWLELAAHLIEEHGLPADIAGEGEQQPVHWAAAWASVRMVGLLVAHGASLEAQSADGCVPLHYASMYGRHTTVYYLLAKGCRVNAADSQGYTALHRASCQPHRLVVRTILAEGGTANVNQCDATGRSALHWAVTTAEGSAKSAVLSALLDAGIAVTGPGATDVEGRDVLAHARFHGFERTAEMLESYLAEKRPEHGSTRGPPTRCAGLLSTAGRSGVPPVRWLAQALGSVGRNLGLLGRGSRWDRADRHDPGRLCVLWFSCSIALGVWIWWQRFVGQGASHAHLGLTCASHPLPSAPTVRSPALT